MSAATEQLMEILRLLALEPAEQVRALPGFADVPDELANLFGDHYEITKRQGSVSQFRDAARSLLEEMDATFAGMAGRKEFFSTEAMIQQKEWVAIRAKARKVLDLLGVEQRSPRLDWIAYVEGGE